MIDTVAGTLVGVLAAEPPLADQLTALLPENVPDNPDGLNPNALWEISEAQYHSLLQKKIPSLAHLPHSNSPPLSATHIKGKGGAVVGEPGAGAPAPEKVLESAADAVVLGEVKSETVPDVPKKGKSK